MNWQQFWNNRASLPTDQDQVARLVDGKVVDAQMLNRIASDIQSKLGLKSSDSLLDVCCGNGALTELLLPHCKNISAVDFSPALIDEAKKRNASIQFICDGAEAFELHQQFDKILLYFSFQYFESVEHGKKVIKNLLHHAKPGATILLGDITDQRQIFHYYNSPKKVLKWIYQNAKGTNNMGKFWHPSELDAICKSLGIKGEAVNQQRWQPFAYYRFDYIITT